MPAVTDAKTPLPTTAPPEQVRAFSLDGKSSLSVDQVCAQLAARRYNIQDEKSLQDGLELVLKQLSLSYSREHILDSKNRPDFLLGRLAVEVKTQGTLAKFLRQAQRYLEKSEVDALIAIGTPKWLSLVPGTLCGKPIYSVRLLGSLF